MTAVEQHACLLVLGAGILLVVGAFTPIWFSVGCQVVALFDICMAVIMLKARGDDD